MKSDEQLDKELAAVLGEHDAQRCACGHEIGWGDVAWNNRSTEVGTGYCTVQITCEGCGKEIAHVDSWHPLISDRDEVLHVLREDWGKHI